jgi:hypothetical protein
LALELRERRLVDAIFPVLIGDLNETEFDAGRVQYSNYFPSGCHPTEIPDTHVNAIEQKLQEHLSRQGLGYALTTKMTVSGIVEQVIANQGGFLRGDPEVAIQQICELIVTIKRTVAEKKLKQRELLKQSRSQSMKSARLRSSSRRLSLRSTDTGLQPDPSGKLVSAVIGHSSERHENLRLDEDPHEDEHSDESDTETSLLAKDEEIARLKQEIMRLQASSLQDTPASSSPTTRKT